MPGKRPSPPAQLIAGPLDQPEGRLGQISSALAEVIGNQTHDFPAVQFSDSDGSPAIVWTQFALTIDIYVTDDPEPTMMRKSDTHIEVNVASVSQGMLLLRCTESSLQGNKAPYIRLL